MFLIFFIAYDDLGFSLTHIRHLSFLRKDRGSLPLSVSCAPSPFFCPGEPRGGWRCLLFTLALAVYSQSTLQ